MNEGDIYFSHNRKIECRLQRKEIKHIMRKPRWICKIYDEKGCMIKHLSEDQINRRFPMQRSMI